VHLYKRCQVDFFAAYLLPDGLVRRLTEFQDIHSLYYVLWIVARFVSSAG